MVARKDVKHFPESKNTSQNPKHIPVSKTLPRIQKHVPEFNNTFQNPDSGTCFGNWEVFCPYEPRYVADV